MSIKNLSFKSESHLRVVNEWSQTVKMPSTKAVILAIDLAKKYQQLELENRALKMLLASTQTPDNNFYGFVTNEIGQETKKP